MFGTHDFIVFLAAEITLNLMPGPDTLYIIGRSIAQGRRVGFLSVLGISSGCAVHTVAAAFGLSAILVLWLEVSDWQFRKPAEQLSHTDLRKE